MSDDRQQLMREALEQIRDLRGRLAQAHGQSHEAIAVVGMACRFPGDAEDLDSFWEVLAAGRNMVGALPAERFDVDALYDADPDAAGRTTVRHGGFLRDIAGFDPQFFAISPLEAEAMDPQQRLLLEGAWHALEDAGIAPASIHGSAAGVFVGIGSSDYALLRARHQPLTAVDAHLALGTSHSVASGRLSYVLGLRGPSYAVDTACSSSLVAVHLAVQSLRARECSLAIAAGVAALLAPDYFINFSHARMLATDGRCKTFDAAADGYVRGEGCGVLVLKRLADALSAGDRIHAVIRGSATNQDGRSSGLTAPNGPSQEDVIRAALADGQVDPLDVDYVEAHGTGTPLGDPIEVQALGAVLCAGRGRERPLRLGSVKTNLGHIEAASGVAGLMKTVLALEHERLPMHLHFDTPSPHIDWQALPIEVLRTAADWPRGPKPRLAGVSSFGFSGTNAHVVLEEAPAMPPAQPPARAMEAVCLSARTATGLRTQAQALSRSLAARPESRLADIALTANAGRTHQLVRAAAVVATRDELRETLDALGRGGEHVSLVGPRTAAATAPDVAFLFSGHGSVHVGMGRDLYSWGRVFREELDRCAALLQPVLERPLLEVMFGGDEKTLGHSVYAQPALFALEYALARQWQAFGVQPAAVLGHSAGEFAAACIAGAITLEDALRLIAARGRLVHELRGADGAMYALLADTALVEKEIAGTAVAIAAYNGPGNLVVSGPVSALDPVLARLAARGAKVRRLAIPQGFHSSQLDPMLDAFEDIARGCAAPQPPEVDYISNVSGGRLGAQRLDAGYWRRHAREPVRFADGLNSLLAATYPVFLEIGPANVLSALGAEFEMGAGREWLASLDPATADARPLLTAAARLHLRGVTLDWRELASSQNARPVSLAATIFERSRYWFDAEPAAGTSGQASVANAFELAAAAAASHSEQGPFDLAPASFAAKWQALAKLTLAYQVETLRRLGAFAAANEKHTATSLCASYGLAAAHAKLMDRWLAHLAQAGLLAREADGFRAPAPLPPAGLEAARELAAVAVSDYPEMLAYVASCGPRLPEVLKGAVSPLDTLFPDGSFEIADGLYHHSAVARYLNSMVRAALVAAAAAVPPGRRLRILEIGAGTGGTTAAVVGALDAAHAEYTFTDVSDFFFDRARQRLGALPFVRYSRLDIDQEPEAQGYTPGSYDVVIAANVLHATRDLAATLGRVARLLGEGGVLLLNETTAHPTVFDITTGLIEGWHVFADKARQDNPLIAAPAWLELLQGNGFVDAQAFPGEDSVAAALGNHVIVAGRPGAALAGAATAAAPAAAKAAVAEPAEAAEDLAAELQGLPLTDREERLAAFVRERVMRLLRFSAAQRPSYDARLTDLGLDSLMAVQLRNDIATRLRLPRKLPATLMFDYPSIGAIAGYLLRELFAAPPAAAPAAAGRNPATGGEVDLAALSEDEVERLMLQKLAALSGPSKP